MTPDQIERKFFYLQRARAVADEEFLLFVGAWNSTGAAAEFAPRKVNECIDRLYIEHISLYPQGGYGPPRARTPVRLVWCYTGRIINKNGLPGKRKGSAIEPVIKESEGE